MILVSARFGVYRVFNCVSREFFLRTVYSGNIGDPAIEYENAAIAQKKSTSDEGSYG